MQPLAVVEHLDVGGDREACSNSGRERFTVVHLVLQGSEEGVRGCVVNRHTPVRPTLVRT